MAVLLLAAYGLGRLGSLVSTLRPLLIVVFLIGAAIWIARGAKS
jgi:hypothetical protein